MKLSHLFLAPLLAIASQTEASSLRARRTLEELSKPRIKETVRPLLEELEAHTLFSGLNSASLAECHSSLAPKYQWTRQWYSQIDTQHEEVVNLLFDDYKINLFPFYYKYFFDQSEEEEFFGANGEYTQEQVMRYEQLEAFWELTDSEGGPADITVDHTILMGAHGSILSDRNALRLIFTTFFEDLPSDLEGFMDTFQSTVKEVFPRGFDFPLFTANAAAFDSSSAIKKDAVIVGDGILELLEHLGLHEGGADYVLGHEFGHQLQFVLFTQPQESTPEKSRETELMADAFAAYFLGHALGGNFALEEIDDVMLSAFFVGDCQPTSETHHGTPRQRKCAIDWAADKARAEGTAVSKLADFVDAFSSALPKILDVDSGVCPFQSVDIQD